MRRSTVCLMGLFLSWSAIAEAELGKPLARTGEQAPGGGLDFAVLHAPVVNEAGAISFQGTFPIAGAVTQADDSGVFIYRDGGNTIEATFVVREGDALPGAEAIAEGFNDMRLGDGEVLVMHTGTSTNNSPAKGGNAGIWLWSGGAMQKVVAYSDEVPAAPDPFTEWGLLQRLRFSKSGSITFLSSLFGVGGMANDVIGQATLQSPTPDAALTRTEHTVPSASAPNDKVDKLFWLAANASGAYAYPADIKPPLPPTYKAILLGNQTLKKTGDATPGIGGQTFTGFEFPRMNEAGTLMYFGRMGALRALFVREGSGAYRTLTVEGEIVPFTSGATIAAGTLVDNRAVMGGNGDVAVLTSLEGANVTTTNDEAIVHFPAGLQVGNLVVREGDPAPGLGAGVVFGRLFRTPSTVPNKLLSINASGRIVFRAELDGTGIGLSNDDSLWTYDPATKALELVFQNGDSVDMCNGETRTLKDFDVILGSGVQDGVESGFSDSGFLGVAAELSLAPGETGKYYAQFVPNVADPTQTPTCAGGPGGSGGAAGSTGVGGSGAGSGVGGSGGGSSGGRSSSGGGCAVGSVGASGSGAALGLLLVLGLLRRRRFGIG